MRFRFLRTLCFGLLLPALLPACGDDETPPPLDDAQRATSLPRLPALSDAERAEFALDRLLKGPLPRTGRFKIPTLHRLNLEHAQQDLAALPAEALRLLDDPALQASLTRPLPNGFGRNGWHGVLDVLAVLPDVPTPLAVRWTEPVLGAHDLPLARRATRVLARTGDPAVAPILLSLLEVRGADPELSLVATATLLDFGTPWVERALDAVMRYGSSVTWGRVAPLLADHVEEGAASAQTPAQALAWWALLTEGGGPMPTSPKARVLRSAWDPMRVRLDPTVWPRDPSLHRDAADTGRLLAPALALESAGVLPGPPSASAVFPWRHLLNDGRAVAAQARCILADLGSSAHLAAVRADLASADPVTRYFAESCPVLGTDPERLEAAEDDVARTVEALEAGEPADTDAVAPRLRNLAAVRPAAALSAAWTVLRRARPYRLHEKVLRAAYEVLREQEEDALVEAVADLARSSDPEEASTATALIRWAPDPRYAEPLEEGLEWADSAQVALRRRLLVLLHALPADGDDAPARAAFVERLVAWIDGEPDAEATGLASGLAELGAEGAAALAAGLEGPRRAVYLRAILGRSDRVATEVAAALLEPLDAATPPGERQAVLVTVYRTAPPGAAPHLAAARRRLPPEAREEVDDILEVLRHRVPR